MIDSPIRTVTEVELVGRAAELFLRRMIDMQLIDGYGVLWGCIRQENLTSWKGHLATSERNHTCQFQQPPNVFSLSSAP
jgi:hypothetical protein